MCFLELKQFKGIYSSDGEIFPMEEGDPLSKRNGSTHVYLNESLTPMNGTLLREALKLAVDKEYKYPGYTFKGEVRCKKADNEPFIKIRCKEDLLKDLVPSFIYFSSIIFRICFICCLGNEHGISKFTFYCGIK